MIFLKFSILKKKKIPIMLGVPLLKFFGKKDEIFFSSSFGKKYQSRKNICENFKLENQVWKIRRFNRELWKKKSYFLSKAHLICDSDEN